MTYDMSTNANKQDKEVTPASLSRDIERFAYQGGYQAATVFDDMLRYIVHGFSLPTDKGLEGWEYKKDENQWFYGMVGRLAQSMQRGIEKRGWFDALGCIYEDIIASKSRRSNSGQFFTPPDLCDLMTELTTTDSVDTQKVVGDPTCGSGRTLLSFNAKHPGRFFVAEDIDRTCVLMTVVNFLYHGIRAEVVWHDSLNIEPVWGVWRVNPHLNNPFHQFGHIPHIEPIAWEDAWLKRHWDRFYDRKRLASKLRDNVTRLENQLRAFQSIPNPTEDIRARIAHLTKCIGRMRGVIERKYS